MKKIFLIPVIVFIYFVLNSEEYLKIVVNLSEYVWGLAFVLSLVLFFPLSFVTKAKKICSKWFLSVCILFVSIFFIKARYLMMSLGEINNLDSRYPSIFVTLVTVYRSIFAPGFYVYFPLFMLLVWAYASFKLSERLGRQLNNISVENKNNKNIFLILTITLTIATGAVIYRHKYDQISVENKQIHAIHILLKVISTYKQSGMLGLTALSDSEYKGLSKAPSVEEIRKCALIDMFAIELDKQISNKAGFPPNEYFNVNSFQLRVGKYFIDSGFDMNQANQYMNTWETEVLIELKKLDDLL